MQIAYQKLPIIISFEMIWDFFLDEVSLSTRYTYFMLFSEQWSMKYNNRLLKLFKQEKMFQKCFCLRKGVSLECDLWATSSNGSGKLSTSVGHYITKKQVESQIINLLLVKLILSEPATSMHDMSGCCVPKWHTCYDKD